MHIGIDLGTTFCCVAYVDEEGEPKVIRNADGESTTPSVVWFDGKTAFVGKKANDRKFSSPPQNIREFIKRDMGKPAAQPPVRELPDERGPLELAPYEIGGFKYGAVGMSAIILRKLKKDAINYLKSMGRLETSAAEQDIQLDTVITVPAYFGQTERNETRLAGRLAGLNVVHIVNEPTAAALTYGLARHENHTVMVFDLGGGTLDVTFLRMEDGEPRVIASDGHNSLGGRDWDRLIESYLYEAFYRETRREIPDDMGFEIQQKALQAKFELSEREQTVVTMTGEDGDCIVPLRRSAPPAGEDDEDFEFDLDRPFCFEERATDLLTQCQAICERVRAKAGICRWVDVDEIILAGGACRMPMIPKMLDQLYAPKRVRTSLEGFSYDTAIAIGAALYGHHHARVRDVVPKTYGVKYLRAGRLVIDHFIHKNTPLPCSAERETHAYADAVLEVHEGESQAPDECRLVGHLALQNPQGRVRVRLLVEEHGLIEAAATWPGTDRWMKRTITDQYGPEWLDELRRRLSSIIIRA